MIHQPPERISGTGTVSKVEPPAVSFDDVSFSYGPHAEVLRHVSFCVKGGEMLALVGESGCGKSTAVALIQGLYPVGKGCVRVGGIDVRHLDIISLRSSIGIVPQRVELMSGTVLENIALGEDEPDVGRVGALVEELGLRATIEALPGGLLARIGEGGSVLSAGQQQRIALARALYRPVRLLILDEATSALDSMAERLVELATQRFRERGGTVIVVAHRLSALRCAERIVVMSQGRVVEEGTHESLLSRYGKYREMWKHYVRDEQDAPDRSRPSTAGPVVIRN